MAARIRRIRQDDELRFYVYVLTENDLPIYVGKGSGGRFEVQKRKFCCTGYIAGRYYRESDAYKAEARLIKKLRPELNKNRGGGGTRAKRKIPCRREPCEIEMERIGSRKYSAKLLLGKFGIEKYISPENLQKLAVIANS